MPDTPSFQHPANRFAAFTQKLIDGSKPSGPERYRKRVLAHLPTLADRPARIRFLRAEREKWLERELAFKTDVAAGRPTPDGVTIFDYIETISDLDGFLAAEQAPVPV